MIDPNALSLPALFVHLTADGVARRLLDLARDEDLGAAGDVTTRSIVAADGTAEATMRARSAGVVAGLAAVPMLLDAFDAELRFDAACADGDRCSAGSVLGTLAGASRDLLAVERTLLNLVGRLCGVATQTRAFVDAVAGTSALVCDTRKTTPGWRGLEKYAVRCGGGTLHRLGLHDAALFKDNHLGHLTAPGWAHDLDAAIRRARADAPLRFVEVEVDTLAQLDVVLALAPGRVDLVLLDNMDDGDVRRAVAARDASGRPIALEASGGIDLARVRAVAATGVERVAVGALTHGAASLDVGLDLGKPGTLTDFPRASWALGGRPEGNR